MHHPLRAPGFLLALLLALTLWPREEIALGRDAETASPSARLVFTRNFNVFLMDTTGRFLDTVTTRGTGYPGIIYPWYAWSPDGKYLLLVRQRSADRTGTMLLLDGQGRVLRELATIPAPTDFWPSWDMDRDQIAYEARQTVDRVHGVYRHTVNRMDVSGHTFFLFSYTNQEGCGGGTGDPAGLLYWEETGFGARQPRMAWSLRQGLAAYSSSCGGGVKITDLRTRRTRTFTAWNEPALSAGGMLAVTRPSSATHSVILLVRPRSGAVIRRVAPGSLPVWARDGRTLYFVQRTLRTTHQGRDQLGNRTELRFFRSSIYRASAQGTALSQLYSSDAFGLGAPSLIPDGRSLVFSRVDNARAIWNHRRGDALPTEEQAYRPQVQIVRLDTGGKVTILARNAGRPLVRPVL